ncbi:hypothetical protein [Micromonospora maris]|nr:hypothetical protein [Micromonospora maris]
MITAVLADLRSGEHRGVVVDSPPGTGNRQHLIGIRESSVLSTIR